MKRFLSIVLAIMMMVSVVPITASATETSGDHIHVEKIIPEFAPTETTPGLTASVECSFCKMTIVEQKVIPAIGTTDDPSAIVSGTCGTNATWTFNTKTGALIISGTGAMEKYKSSQARPWQDYLKQIKTIIINDGITKIDNYAFRDCTNLLYVSIPESVTTIVGYVFRNCTSLVSATIPDSVTGIGSEVFKGCTNLISVSISKNVMTLGDNIFNNCTSLFEVVVPENVYYIYDNAFENCTNLKRVTLGANLQTIGNKVFNSCTSLTDVYYAGTEEDWSKISIGTNNAPLENATIHFGGVIGDDGETHKHEYEVETVAPTCLEPGYVTYTCSCGDTYTENYVALGHTKVVKPATAPTTTQEGNTYDERCLTCGEIYTQGDVIPVLNESSFANVHEKKNIVGVFDMEARTLTFYGTGELVDTYYFTVTYNKELKQDVCYESYADTIIIKEGITGICDYAFEDWSLDSVVIADTVRNIGKYAFFGSRVSDVVMGDGVTNIGDQAFSCCYLLEEIELGKNVKNLGTCVFFKSDSLTSVIIDSENPYLTIDAQGVIYNKERTKVVTALENLGITDYILPDTIEEIAGYTFYKNPTIESISIPDTLTTVGAYAFYKCDNLDTIYYSGTKEQWLSAEIGNNNRPLLSSIFRFGNGEIGGVCGDKAMWQFDAITGVFNVIGTGAMYDYTTTTDYSWNAYEDSIKSVNINSGITTIGEGAFGYCDNLTEVTIPDTVTKISRDAFRQCVSLENISLPDSITVIADSAFNGCTSLKEIEIPYTVTSIGSYVFKDCDSLTSITIPHTVTIIGTDAFRDCNRLTTAVLGNGLSVVSSYMFSGCYNLENLVLGRNITAINDLAFSGCRSLRVVTLPEGVNSIGEMAFGGCTGLTDIIIPKTVTTIGDNAFVGCDLLSDIYYSGTEEDWSKIDIDANVGTEFENATKHFNGSVHTHSYEALVIDPTCIEHGHTMYVCRCGDSYYGDFTDPTGHSYTAEITTPATHTATGIMTYTCHCGDTYTEIIDKLPDHNHEANVTVPTCTEQGYTTYTCECGDTYIDDYVEATGHNYVDNVCTNCGDEIIIVLNGWQLENGKWAYYENNVKLTNKWIKDSVGWCYVGADGYCLTNAWAKDSVGWCYLDANGRMVCSNWVYDGGKWYFMDTDGYMVSNKWIKDSKGWVYLGSSGAMLTNSWVKDSIGWCYVGADGYCLTNDWAKDSTGWCYLDSNGRMVYNQWVYYNNQWYYLNANGYMVTGTVKIGPTTYKFASNGALIS